jgi:hypothetical protein
MTEPLPPPDEPRRREVREEVVEPRPERVVREEVVEPRREREVREEVVVERGRSGRRAGGIGPATVVLVVLGAIAVLFLLFLLFGGGAG